MLLGHFPDQFPILYEPRETFNVWDPPLTSATRFRLAVRRRFHDAHRPGVALVIGATTPSAVVMAWLRSLPIKKRSAGERVEQRDARDAPRNHYRQQIPDVERRTDSRSVAATSRRHHKMHRQRCTVAISVIVTRLFSIACRSRLSASVAPDDVARRLARLILAPPFRAAPRHRRKMLIRPHPVQLLASCSRLRLPTQSCSATAALRE